MSVSWGMVSGARAEPGKRVCRSYHWAVMESLEVVSVSRRVSRPVFWSLDLGLEGLRSRSRRSRLGLEGFRSRSRALRLETLHRLFFTKFCKKVLKKAVLKNDCSKFSRSKRSVAKLSLLLYCLRDGENNLPSTPFKIYTDFNKKCACNNEPAACNLCNERLGVCFAKDYLWTVFTRVLLWNPIGLYKRGGEVPKSFFFEKPNKTMSCFRSAFQSTLLKHAGEAFLVLRNADFLSSKMPRNSLEEKFCS